MKHEFEMRERREKMLQDIHEGKDDFGSGGPGLGKKRSQRDEGSGVHGVMGFLQGMKPGFLQR